MLHCMNMTLHKRMHRVTHAIQVTKRWPLTHSLTLLFCNVIALPITSAWMDFFIK